MLGQALTGCEQIDPVRARCLAGLWQSEPDSVFALNVREDDTARLTAFDGRAWTLTLDRHRWIGGAGQTASARDTILDDAHCADGWMRLTHRGKWSELRRVALDQRAVRFASGGLTLVGKLVLRKGDRPDTLVVLLHGSEKRSALASNPLQYLLPSQGIATFVFDKRGTGGSAGDYTQNLAHLAQDAASALLAARKTMTRPDVRAGFHGGSQGAWIGPLAAGRAPAHARPGFVIAAYGLAQSPMEEDREEVFDDLRRRGFGDAATLAKARELTDATAAVMRSNFADGLDRLDALKDKYGAEPWYAAVEGEFTGDFLSMPSWLLAIVGPWFDEGITWDYDPLPVIKGLDVPMLWVLAGKDSEAPSSTTLEILRGLQAGGVGQIDIALFPLAEHGMVLFEEKGRERRPTRIAPGYHQLLATWARTGRLTASPGVQYFPAGATVANTLPPH